jgi:indolepyruvate ferredoxin oxidoreductase alpha subunit
MAGEGLSGFGWESSRASCIVTRSFGETDVTEAVLLGNAAIARGLVEAGVHFVTSYPGTPSSEILPNVVRFGREEGLDIYTEWSVNERVAFEVALAASYTGKRTAVIMKQVGLNVAADPLMSSVYTGVRGGFLVITTDDPGPFSSQTEQDSRFWGMFSKAPVFDPSSPADAKEMIARAFEVSEKYQVPVIFRPVLRVCHARQNVELRPPRVIERPADFQKDADRWAATPRFRFTLHGQLNRKLVDIRVELEGDRDLNPVLNADAPSEVGIIAAGINFAILQDLLREYDVAIPVLRVSTPFPFPAGRVREFAEKYPRVLVLEATDEVIEMQVPSCTVVHGRGDGTIAREGEPTPENTLSALRRHFPGRFGEPAASRADLETAVASVSLPVRRPTLCPGCPHRSAFFAIRRTFPKGIYTSDIGCYTLGTNLGAVDTVLNMGASVSMAAGFFHAYRQDQKDVPVVATIGDSTFYHAGIPPLVDAVYTDARFILVILDNAITAMTGMQPTPGTGILADGSRGMTVPLEDIVRGTGVRFLRVVDPYDIRALRNILKEAHAHTREADGGVAVIIARHPCLLQYRDQVVRVGRVVVTDECNACWTCVDRFECPAISKDEEAERAVIDYGLCIECGVCRDVCSQGALVVEGK